MPEVMEREIPGLPGYTATSDGRLVSYRQRDGVVDRRELRPFRNRKGYSFVKIVINGRPKTYGVHQLVAAAFHGPRPAAGQHARHLNGDNTDNRPENLAWGSAQDNTEDQRRLGRIRRGRAIPSAKVGEVEVRAMRRAHEAGATLTSLARLYGVGRSTVQDICYRRTWAHVE